MHYATPQTVCVRDEEGVMAFNREDLLRYSGSVSYTHLTLPTSRVV